MASNLECVPPEILVRIAGILDTAHPPSLLAFACANKGCYVIASISLYRTIKITIDEGQQLAHDVKTLEKMLQRDESFAHVRRLILLCKSPGTRYRYISLDPCERMEDDLELRGCWDLYRSESHLWPSNTGRIADSRWQQLGRLVRQLPGLTDLFWASPQSCQFPQSLLQALHEDLPRCRLHHYGFHLDSLDGKSSHPHDFAAARSPCLYSIGDLWHCDHTMLLAAVQRLRPPRLKRIYLWKNSSGIGWDSDKCQRPQSVLREHIQLDGPESPRSVPTDLVSTRTFGEISALRVLKLYIVVSPKSLPPPESFTSLVTLTLTCSTDASSRSKQSWTYTAFFLRHLPRLATLQLREWDRRQSIAPCLGSNLRTLELSTRRRSSIWEPLKDEILRHISKCSPHLESLAVEVRRSRGDAAEVARYRALGRLPWLRHLDLTLDAAPPGFFYSWDANGVMTHYDTGIETWFDEQDKHYLDGNLHPLREGHARDFLINSAIDETLARSIFEVIDGAKAKRSDGVAPVPLERLKLRVSGGSSFKERRAINSPTGYVWPFLTAVQRTWLVERDVRDDARDVLHVHETKPWVRTSCLDIPRVEEEEKSPRWMAIWRRIWPNETEGRVWWDDWKSFPLALTPEMPRNGDLTCLESNSREPLRTLELAWNRVL